MYLKRVLGVAQSCRNRLVYLMVGCPTLVETIRSKFNLGVTESYKAFLDAYDQKFAAIDPQFYGTPVMLYRDWTRPYSDKRHICTC